MAERRMFAKTIINSARFLKMPSETQALYFHLALNADDDGIVEAFSICRSIGASEDNLKILVAKGFVNVLNDDLVTHIMDWNEHNKIRPDRKIDSIYKDLLLKVFPDVKIIEKKQRSDVKKDMDGQWTDNGRTMDGIGKDRIGEVSLGKDRTGEKNNIVDEKLHLAKRTIDFLNQTVKKSFNYTDGNLKEIKSQINKLLKNGDTLEVIENKFAHVIRVKCNEWINNQEMKKHLNPVTLFRESNFDKYLNQDMGFSTSDIVDKIYEARNAK